MRSPDCRAHTRKYSPAWGALLVASCPSRLSQLLRRKGCFQVHGDPMELTNLADDPKHAATRAELSKLVNAYT